MYFKYIFHVDDRQSFYFSLFLMRIKKVHCMCMYIVNIHNLYMYCMVCVCVWNNQSPKNKF